MYWALVIIIFGNSPTIDTRLIFVTQDACEKAAKQVAEKIPFGFESRMTCVKLRDR